MASQTLQFFAFFTASKVGKTGLTVTVNVWKKAKSGGTRTSVASAASATEEQDGWYSYVVSSADPRTYDYGATFITTDATVDFKHIPGLWSQFSPAAEQSTPDAAAGASGGLPLSVDGSGRVDVLKVNGTSQTARDLGASVIAASVTGNVGGNVTGSVGSVVGAVGSVTGNVGGNVNGNVSGSVGSVTGAVGSVTGSVGGSVTGDVGGKVLGGGSGTISGDGVRASSVTGAVGSVTGAVGSVTGNVGGDVAGKVLGGGAGSIGGDGVRAASVTGAVGSVTGAVGSVTGNVGGNLTGTIGGFTSAALQSLFLTDSGKVFANAVAGSVVKETALGSSGGGGSSLSAQDVADAMKLTPSTGAAATGSVQDKLGTIIADIGNVGGVPGSGADACTMTITNTTTSGPLADADVWVTSDADGDTVVAGTLQTDSNGMVTFLLDAGSTYYLWVQKDGVNSIEGQLFVAAAD